MTDSEVPFFTDSSVRPPTEHIYPIQTPYGDIHGLTPPPEDFDHLLGEIHSQGYHLTDPPTPPRTEGVSSPSSRSSLSGRSPSVKVDPYSVYDSLSPGTTNPTSPVSDAVMGKDMDHGRFTSDFAMQDADDYRRPRMMSEQKHHKPASPVSDSAVEHVRHHSDFAMQDVDEYRNSGPQGIMMPADNDLSDYASLDMNDFTPFFDFNSAASESKPSPNDLDFKNHIPQYQNTFSPSPFSAGLQLTPQTHIAHVSSRKRTREREDTDALGFSGGYTIEEDVGPKSPMVDVKKESSAPPAALTNSTDHQSNFADYMTRQADSPEDFNFEPPAHSPQAPIPQKGSTSIGLAVPNGAQYLEGTQCRLFMDFPKNTKASSSGFSYTSHDGTVLIKSRVETQIPVRFVLYPPSAPYEVLRLPRHTIAKVKFIEDGHPMSNPETLDLQATLVCASAMQERDQLERALHEARGDPIPDWIIRIQEHKLKEDEAKIEAALARPDGDSSPTTSQKEGSGKEDRKEKIDYSKPRYGAPVNICEQCMNRERKRASRKKNRKAEEEEMWARDEHRRIIVFNTNQVRAFEKRTALDRPLTTETQMRICCYCRHHGEKEGFRVIFTVKDNKGNVVAQTVSPVIVITDDHKNAGPPVPQAPATSVTDGNAKQHSEIAPQQPQTPAPSQDIGQYPGFMVPNIQPTAQEMPPTYSRRYSQNGQDQHMSGLSNGHSNGHSNCHSNGLSSGYTSAHSNTSPSPTVRSSLSPGLHQTKRRKSSKVPANLAMTPSEPPQPHRPQNMSFAPRSQNGGIHQQWLNGSQGPMVQSDGLYYNNIGWGSNSGMDGSNGFGMSPGNMSHVAPKMFGGRSMVNSQSPGGFMHHQPIPLINRVVPGEGTCRGGIEITILGGHFVNGLTVMFGDVPATDTIFYSDTTLLCRLPPNPSPGAVIVSLKNVDSSYRPETVPVFTYIDDVEKELMALALTVVGMKMKGEMGSSKQIALSILRDSGMAAEAINSSQNNGGNQRTHLESTLLACLDFIDMDESPHPASLNHKNKSGQTMLHLACMLGMQKFAAALLARGVRADARDKNGWTPLHFAARCNRQDVVRRLLINGADAGLRTRGGETAADLGESDQIVRATRSVQIHSRQHSRSSSVSSETRYGRSRSGSAASITMPPKMRSLDGYYADGEYDDPESDSEEDRLGRHSRKPSMHDLQSAMRISRIHSMHDLPAAMKASLAEQAMDNSNSTDTTPASIAAGSPLSPPAMMAAWMEACREQLAHSFQNLQINIPAPGDYQTLFQNQMARLQNPMPKWNRPDASEGAADYKWSELLHPPVPPAYDDLYPEGKEFDRGLPEEKGEPVESAPNQTLDLKASTLALTINRSASPATSSTSIDLREIHRHFARGDSVLSKEQQAEYLAHIRKMKRIESDRRLFFFWIPVLIVILILMAFNRGPQVWETAKQAVGFVKHAIEEPLVVWDRLRVIATRAIGGPAIIAT